MRQWVCVLALGTLIAASGHAQLIRQFPANGKLGELIGQQQPMPLVLINNKVMRLAPGGRIFDQDNRIILHVYLPQHAQVLFVEDMNGDLSHIYLLRPDELERLQRAR